LKASHNVDTSQLCCGVVHLKKLNIAQLPYTDKFHIVDGDLVLIEIVQNGKYTIFIFDTPDYMTEQRNLGGVVELYTRLFKEVGFWPK